MSTSPTALVLIANGTEEIELYAADRDLCDSVVLMIDFALRDFIGVQHHHV